MKKVLIANRGEIAVRIIRACKELGLETVAIHSVADKDSLHAKLASESICIGPGPSLKSYLHIPAVMSAAELSGADAIHPGYGFLSENSDFARICGEHRIKFIGPDAKNIKLLGDKILAREAAMAADVSLLPGSPDAVKSKDEAVELAEKIGLPVIIKAAAGGGGRGMKIVWKIDEIEKMWQIASSEAMACFGNPACFIEKYLANPRHIEVQIVADEYGNTVALGERDCSIQRRHQKVVEEAPCPVLSEKERATVTSEAIKLCQSLGYYSLGTVEFLYQDGKFYFMEMNTRVQVEHPVTECVFDVDLIKEQIMIAQGEPLSEHVRNAKPRGHAIECRINAEDPKTFAPWPGTITDYHEPGGPGVRIDSMVYADYRIPSLYDSMLAKLITYGRNRSEATARMQRALEELRIEGIRTTIDFHRHIVRDPRFLSNELSTRFLEDFDYLK